MKPRVQALFVLVASLSLGAAQPTAPWAPDLGNGTFKNPIIYADYSDPDVTRVGDDFYLVASSFTCVPGLPILHSNDLVNWTLINHALPVQVPEEHFNAVQSGGGVWAPAIRFHSGKYYIFYPDPDYGIYQVSTSSPAGEWSQPVLVKAGKGLIDPCPLWDDDGKVWLVHGWANSRSGRNNILTLVPLTGDATQIAGEGKDIILGPDFKVTTLEGPKFYKMNGYYWIFAPVGGVTGGTQAVFRAKNIDGPYEMRQVLAQGGTQTNGPHQGGLVDTPDGKEWWFIHFQDAKAYGRITHLEPVVWRDDGWPVMGNDPNKTGTGEPVATFKKPTVAKTYPATQPQTSDEFNSSQLGLQWQWLANPQPRWFSLAEKPGHLRLVAQPPNPSLVRQPNLLLQKLPAPAFTVTTKLDFTSELTGENAGLIIYGTPCAWIGLVKTPTGLRVSQTVSRPGPGANAPDTATESAGADVKSTGGDIKSGSVYLAFTLSADSRAQFSYSLDGQAYTKLGEPVAIAVVRGSWIGAKFGLFARSVNPPGPTTAIPMPAKADFDWIHVTPAAP